MKAKEMEKLMWKAGIEPNKFSHHFTRMNGSIPDGIEKLIMLVEQATLERVSSDIKAVIEDLGKICADSLQILGASIALECINELKESND